MIRAAWWILVGICLESYWHGPAAIGALSMLTIACAAWIWREVAREDDVPTLHDQVSSVEFHGTDRQQDGDRPERKYGHD